MQVQRQLLRRQVLQQEFLQLRVLRQQLQQQLQQELLRLRVLQQLPQQELLQLRVLQQLLQREPLQQPSFFSNNFLSRSFFGRSLFRFRLIIPCLTGELHHTTSWCIDDITHATINAKPVTFLSDSVTTETLRCGIELDDDRCAKHFC